MTCKYKNEIDQIIIQGNAKVLVETAKDLAKAMVIKKFEKVDEKSSVSTSQIRNIYGSSKKIEMTLAEENAEQLYGRLVLLKPKMAYANGRFNKNFGKDRFLGWKIYAGK